jgi:hypothetical protein
MDSAQRHKRQKSESAEHAGAAACCCGARCGPTTKIEGSDLESQSPIIWQAAKQGCVTCVEVLLRNAAKQIEGPSGTPSWQQRKARYKVIRSAVREVNVAALKTLIGAVPAD